MEQPPNYKDDLEYIKNNLDMILKGKEIEYECPFCNQIEKIRIISSERAQCLKCENEFAIKFRLHLDS